MLSTPCICIIDDHEEVRLSLADSLRKDNYTFLLFERGTDLLEYTGEIMPDVILLDVMMPEVDGFTVCARLKAQEKWQHIPVILVTSLSTRDYMIRGLEAGAEGFLVKPVNWLELRARVKSMLRVKQQYDALQDLLVLREKLSRLVIHDLRQPIAAAMMRSSLIIHRGDINEADKFDLQIIKSQLQRLDSLANDILIAAKMHRGEFMINPQPTSLKGIIQNAHANYEIVAKALKMTLLCELPIDDHLLALDENLIIRVLENLLSNAVKFSPIGGQIKMQLSYPTGPDDPQARIKVSDMGAGIPLKFQDMVFEEYKVLEVREKNGPQVGLGLAFCKMAIEAHNGRIYIENNEPTGTIFIVEL